MSDNYQWHTKSFATLTTNQLYDIFKLRIDVFVVEQTCYYPDIDEHDKHPETLHFFAYVKSNIDDSSTTLAAYLRILPKGTSYKNYISIGRVVVAPTCRGKKLGHQLLQKALDACNKHFPKQDIKISAQEHLEKYYQGYGFVRISDMYLEDNIPHISMLK